MTPPRIPRAFEAYRLLVCAGMPVPAAPAAAGGVSGAGGYPGTGEDEKAAGGAVTKESDRG